MPFYPGCTLIELQCELVRSKTSEAQILSAVVSSSGAVLLNGDARVVQAINERGIELSNSDIASQYLSFYCSYKHGDEGPFFLPDSLNAIPIDGEAEALLPKEVLEHDFSLRPMVGDIHEDAYQVFGAVVLYADALFAAAFKVHVKGMVDMLNDQPIAKDLPIMVRTFDGPWRTPPGVSS